MDMYGIFTYIYHKFKPNVGEYTSPMDPMGFKIFKSLEDVNRKCILRNRIRNTKQTRLKGQKDTTSKMLYLGDFIILETYS